MILLHASAPTLDARCSTGLLVMPNKGCKQCTFIINIRIEQAHLETSNSRISCLKSINLSRFNSYYDGIITFKKECGISEEQRHYEQPSHIMTWRKFPQGEILRVLFIAFRFVDLYLNNTMCNHALLSWYTVTI